MPIDILTYELKYKNNREVLDLLAAYQESEEFLQCEHDNDSKKEDKISGLEKHIEALHDDIEQWRKDVNVAIDELSDLKNLKKAEILDYVSKALTCLDSLESDMRI